MSTESTSGPGAPSQTNVRSDEAIERLRQERGGPWPLIRWVHRRRPLLTALLVLAAPVHVLLDGDRPVDLLEPRARVLFWLAWVLMVVGVGVRVWGSGNLRKNQEITSTGVYRVVRHPLYFGSLAVFLAFFLTVGDVGVGLALFAALLAVYYATMRSEEEFLSLKFPERFAVYRPPPRFVPDLSALPEALRTDRFSLRSAYRNYGLRSLWVLVLLPLFLRLLIWLQESVQIEIQL